MSLFSSSNSAVQKFADVFGTFATSYIRQDFSVEVGEMMRAEPYPHRGVWGHAPLTCF